MRDKRKKSFHDVSLESGSRGFTLMEMLFVAALLPMLFIAMYGVTRVAQDLFHTNNVYGQLNASSIAALRFIGEEIAQTNPLAGAQRIAIAQDANGNDVVRFQIPVDWDNDGDAVDAAMNPKTEWGAYLQLGQAQNGVLGAWVRYRLDQTQLKRDVVDVNFNPLPDTETLVANQITNFNVVQNGNYVTMNMSLTGTNEVGRQAQAETLTETLQVNTLLRNAAS
ncbi:MAG: hypothetical protein A2Z83_08710 [Omnitrophica bacterium GWA2_52_8]|nr:MAG: hypothetical protein A2Z83_08710 [Omnitrophica bacterium GWA2_52_8]